MISSSKDIIDFVGTPPLMRIALRVAMATMHFQIAQTGFLGALFFGIVVVVVVVDLHR